MTSRESLGVCLLAAGRGFLDDRSEALRAALIEAAPGLEPPWRGRVEELAAACVDIEVEHVRLFLSPQGAVCPPWQSVQADPPQMLGPAHHGALNWYRLYGVEPRLDNQPADHAGLLLSFAARLVEEGGEVDLFRTQHLEWLEAFCAEIATATRHEFYRRLAAFTLEMLAALRPIAAE